MLKRFVAVAALVVTSTALVVVLLGSEPPPPRAPRVALGTPTPTPTAKPPQPPAIEWRSSTALGSPTAGRLVRGVKLPAEGRHHLTWDPVRKRAPNRWWRRYGTDDLVRIVLRVTREYAAAHPRAPRVLIGDLSRPLGGDFGRRFGPLGHASHQNGLDVDVLRADDLVHISGRLPHHLADIRPIGEKPAGSHRGAPPSDQRQTFLVRKLGDAVGIGRRMARRHHIERVDVGLRGGIKGAIEIGGTTHGHRM